MLSEPASALRQSGIQSQLAFLLYRLSTVAKSVRTLYGLPTDKMEAFLDAYSIYDYDWADEKSLVGAMGVDYYQQMKKKLVDHYSVINHLCAIGQVEKMYIPPALDLSESFIANQELYEQKMCRDLGLKPGDEVLDVGCGRGRVAHHVTSLSRANVTGINIDPDQIHAARLYAASTGLSKQCRFVVADMNELPLPFVDQTFDCAYEIQALTYTKDLSSLFADLHRVLKPGGKLSALDWVRLDKYDPENAHHVDLIRKTKPLIGAIGTPQPETLMALLKKAGFKILISEDVSKAGRQTSLIDYADRTFTRVNALIGFLVRLRLLPAHFKALFDRLTLNGQAFVEADRLGLVTTSYYILAEKAH